MHLSDHEAVPQFATLPHLRQERGFPWTVATIVGRFSLASIHRPIAVACFRLEFLHEEFCEVIPGAGVLPLACFAACPGFLARGTGFGVAVGPCGCGPVRVVRLLRRAARRPRRRGSAIRARGASLAAGAP